MVPASVLNSHSNYKLKRDKTVNYDLLEAEDSSQDSDEKNLQEYNAKMNEILEGSAGKGDLRSLVYDGPAKALKMLSQSQLDIV